MKISYVTTYNASDLHSWSGLGYMIGKALKDQNNEIDYIGDLQVQSDSITRLKSIFYNKIIKKRFDVSREISVAQGYAKQITPFISRDADVIFSPGTIPISLLETKKPKIFYTDATFAGLIDFYLSSATLSKETIKHANYLEQQALQTSSLAIYSSDWAAKTAIENYDVDPSKIKIVPFGANIDCNRDLVEIKSIVSARSSKECHLLFLGVDWNRKGGDMAIKVADKLNKMGLKTILNIAGIRNVPCDNLPNFVINHGFISKSNKDGSDTIDKLFSQCHFLILPTNADCTPVVFSEANSFGLPCITTNIGGIPTIIKDDINGKIFPLISNSSSYANYIYSIFNNKKLYNQLTLSSFNEYESRLNWNIAGKAIMKFINEI